ncbi:MAG: tetratricopeptide repeat protein [Anaerolineae bacterium]|nr:tetratricopeptide repeat protein [Phycisphaerae bacterium]
MADFDKLWNFNDPAGTEQAFRQRLVEFKSAGDTSQELELLTQIARTQGLQQKFDDAHATLDDVERRMRPDEHLVRVQYLLERGRAFNSSKQRERAMPLFMDAMNAAIEHGLDFYAVDAIHMLAIAEPDPAKQLAWNFKAMQLAEASKDDRARGWLGSLYNNIGWIHYGQQRYAEALEIFKKTVTFYEDAKRPKPLRIAHYSVGKTLRALGDLDRALSIQRALHDDAEVKNEPDGYVCEEIAECLLAQGKVNEARPYFAEAYELLSPDEWLKRDEPERLTRLRANAMS